MIRRAEMPAVAERDARARNGEAAWPAPARENVLALLPAHNEQATVKSVLERVLLHVDRALVVDDGSDDATGREAASLRGVEVLRIPRTGKGGALRAGFLRAVEGGYDWVLTLDSDGQHDPDEIPTFLGAVQRGDPAMVVGSRRGDLVSMPWLRRVTNVFMSWLVSRFASQRIPDSQNGYRLIATRVLREVTLTTSHFETESELLVAASRRGFRIGSVPVRTIYRTGGHSHIRKVPDTWRFLKLCASLSREGSPLACPASPGPRTSLFGDPSP
jgi:glycosyltransferase involved in cell wall biosynthesis